MNIKYSDCQYADADFREDGEWEYGCLHPLNKYGGKCLLDNKYDEADNCLLRDYDPDIYQLPELKKCLPSDWPGKKFDGK